MLMLSGPPNLGRGSTVVPRQEPGQGEGAVSLEPLLMDPVFPELTAWTPTSGAAAAPQQTQQGQQAQQVQQEGQEGQQEGKPKAGELRIDLQHAAAEGDSASEVRQGAG